MHLIERVYQQAMRQERQAAAASRQPRLPEGAEGVDGIRLEPGHCLQSEEDIVVVLWLVQEGHHLQWVAWARKRFRRVGLFIKSSSVRTLTGVAQRVVMAAHIRALLGIAPRLAPSSGPSWAAAP